MNKIKQRIRVSIKDYPDEIKANQWKNLYFDINGKTHFGCMIHPSESVAKKSSDEWFSLWGDNENLVPKMPYKCRACDLTHAIQIPLVDKT